VTAADLPATLVAPAKLTIRLRVLGVRADGLHLVDAEMVALDLCDELELSEGSGLVIGGPAAGALGGDPPADNLVDRALRSVGREAAVRLHKRIPAGAGLGGGSADAAAVLRWGGWTDVVGAASLGADVAFCLVGGRARVTGIGEVVEPLPYVRRTVTLLTPDVHCSTPEVYRRWDALGGPAHPSGNDLTDAALDVAPELAAARDELAAATGQRPTLAGSGSTWFVDGAHPGPGRVVATTVPTGWTGW